MHHRGFLRLSLVATIVALVGGIVANVPVASGASSRHQYLVTVGNAAD
jgi:hypothetical protein